jgi:3-deoxy-D-manno-octulosonic-acid transferase
VAASTHAPEERIVLEAFGRISAGYGGGRPRLLIAPRHPERFAEVAALLQASGLSWARRGAAASTEDASCDVVLLDTVGELRAVYPLADLVFVGGSIAPRGGHNILEPALTGKCIITGAHTFNFAAVVRSFLERGALVQLPAVADGEAPEALARALRDLLSDAAKRRRLGERARAALAESRGAAARTVEMLAPLLRQGSGVTGPAPIEGDVVTFHLSPPTR